MKLGSEIMKKASLNGGIVVSISYISQKHCTAWNSGSNDNQLAHFRKEYFYNILYKAIWPFHSLRFCQSKIQSKWWYCGKYILYQSKHCTSWNSGSINNQLTHFLKEYFYNILYKASWPFSSLRFCQSKIHPPISHSCFHPLCCQLLGKFLLQGRIFMAFVLQDWCSSQYFSTFFPSRSLFSSISSMQKGWVTIKPLTAFILNKIALNLYARNANIKTWLLSMQARF